jgi:aspartyl-tRNA(Asn)/glutamyl-tRNA(Gln) amidotransferase subunit C
MAIGADQVTAIARLARLHIDASEVAGYGAQLSRILDLVAEMDRVDTDGVEPLAHPLEVTARLRPDVVTEPDRRGVLQQGAPAVEDGYYLVPKFIE